MNFAENIWNICNIFLVNSRNHVCQLTKRPRASLHPGGQSKAKCGLGAKTLTPYRPPAQAKIATTDSLFYINPVRREKTQKKVLFNFYYKIFKTYLKIKGRNNNISNEFSRSFHLTYSLPKTHCQKSLTKTREMSENTNKGKKRRNKRGKNYLGKFLKIFLTVLQLCIYFSRTKKD